jgi:hypothetical protein
MYAGIGSISFVAKLGNNALSITCPRNKKGRVVSLLTEIALGSKSLDRLYRMRYVLVETA